MDKAGILGILKAKSVSESDFLATAIDNGQGLPCAPTIDAAGEFVSMVEFESLGDVLTGKQGFMGG